VGAAGLAGPARLECAAPTLALLLARVIC